ncbi:MAG TPA: hypothetical protein VL968_11955, partial [Rhodocyclaceae bacterium]|nr:hypothetical protein [Rhodocyclaceae bacterium]
PSQQATAPLLLPLQPSLETAQYALCRLFRILFSKGETTNHSPTIGKTIAKTNETKRTTCPPSDSKNHSVFINQGKEIVGCVIPTEGNFFINHINRHNGDTGVVYA